MKPQKNRPLGRPRHREKILKWALKKQYGRATGLIWLKIGISGTQF